MTPSIYSCRKITFTTDQNPLGPNHPSAANTAPGIAGRPNEKTSKIQSFRPNVILVFKTTIKNAEMKPIAHFYNVFGGHIYMSYFGDSGTPVLDF